jgi:L-threonylcarbamoyladenylate synthase
MEIIKINPERIEEKKLKRAAKVLKKGGIVSYPTETFYGLGADPLNEQAAAKVYRIKGRNFKQPLLLIISEVEDIVRFGFSLPPEFHKLTRLFWPGPLTIALPAPSGLPDYLLGEGGGVAFRLSSNKIARELSRHFCRPITGTSANRSGKPPVTTAAEVADEVGEEIELIIDGGKTKGGPPSTVINLAIEPPCIVRAGAIKKEELEQALGLRFR